MTSTPTNPTGRLACACCDQPIHPLEHFTVANARGERLRRPTDLCAPCARVLAAG